MNEPTVYMLSGPVCVGKTTWISKSGITAHQIGTDHWVEHLSAREGLTYNEGFSKHIKEASATMHRHLMNAIKAKETIIWDQTNLTSGSRAKKLKIFDGTGYKKIGVFFVGATKELIMQRNVRPGKIIPESVVDSMIASYEVPAGNELGPFDEMIFVDAITGETTYHAK